MQRGRRRAVLSLTLRGYWWAVAIVASAAQVLMMVLVTAGLLIANINGGASDDLRAEQLQVASLRQGFLEQEVGISGYLTSADPRLLVSYSQGRQQVEAALAGLRQEAAGTPSAVQVAQVE